MEWLKVFVLLIGIQFCCGHSITQCKEIGQYCQNSFDCCSNRCLSYSYKCVQSNGNDDEIDAIDLKPSVANNIEELVNRFGNDKNKTQSTTLESTSMPSTATNQMSTNQATSSPNYGTNDINRNCYANGLSCSNSGQCCSTFCSSITNMCIHPTLESISTEQMMTSTLASSSPSSSPSATTQSDSNRPPSPTTFGYSASPVSCVSIGHKCYFHNECCVPLRCHGYLHQCVT